MKFQIAARFDWCTLFDGKLNSTMQCRLDLAGEYYLIYIDMPATRDRVDGDNLDVFKLLNQAFGTGLPENALYVQDAGFFTFSHRGAMPGDKTLLDVFPQSMLPASVAAVSGPVVDTSSFWLTIRLKGNYLFNSLIEVGYREGDTPQADISLSGTLSHTLTAGDALRQTIYTAILPDIRLLGLFAFRQLKLQYRFATDAEYAISGKLELALFGQAYGFDGMVVSNARTLKACLSASDPGHEIDKPFYGAMVGVTFRKLIFGVFYTFSDSKARPPVKATGLYRVQGSIDYANLKLSGQIYLQDTTPLLAAVSVDQDLSIGDLFHASIPHFHWPDDLIDITFLDGSCLYYQDENSGPTPLDVSGFNCPVAGQLPVAVPTQKITYLPGFHIHSVFDITLLYTLRIIGDVQIASKGVSATIQLADPIRIYILQITGGKQGGGPVFSFDTVDGSEMGFGCSLLFFQEDFGIDVKVRGRKSQGSELKIDGTLSSAQTFPPMFTTPPTLGFSYSRKDGFKVDNWPAFDFVSDAIDFIEEMKKIANRNRSACGALTDFVNKELLASTFKISPSFSTRSDGLYLVLNGTYLLTAAGIEFARLEFPEAVAFPLPDSLSMQALPAAIADALAGAAESFVTGLMNNSEAVATFLALMAGKQAAQYALSLVCKGLADGAVSAATEAGATALAAAGGVISVLSIAAVGGAVSHSTSKSCFIAGTLVTLADGVQCPIESVCPGDVLLGADGAHNRVLGLDSPRLGSRHLYALNRGRHFVTAEHPFMTRAGWCALDPLATRREIPGLAVGLLQAGDLLCRQDGSVTELLTLTATRADARLQLYNFVLDGNHSYYADGYLVHNKDPQPPPTPGQNPKPPAGLSASYANGVVQASWSSAPNASGYRVQWRDPAGKVLGDVSLSFMQTSASFPVGAEAVAGNYSMAVMACLGDFTSDASLVSMPKLQTPLLRAGLVTPTGGTIGPNVTLLLQWDDVAGATDYLLRLSRNGERLPPEPVKAPALALPWRFDADQPAGDYAFSLGVSAGSAAIPGDDSPVQIWTRLGTPGQVRASSSGTAVTARWTAVAGVQRYLLTLLDPVGKPVCQQVDASGTSQAELQLPPPVSFGTYTLFVACLPDSAASRQVPGIWSTAAQVTVQATLTQLAAQSFSEHLDGAACGRRLIAAYPDADSTAMAIAMQQAGYVSADTAAGLKAAWPGISATALTAALIAAYGAPPVPTLNQLAVQSFSEHLDGAACGRRLIAAFPDTGSTAMAIAMQQAGYPSDATGQGLKAAFPSLSASALLAALVSAYGKA